MAEATTLALETLAERPDRFVALWNLVPGQTRLLCIQVKGSGPLQHIPVFDELLRAVSSCNGSLNLLVVRDYLSQLDGEVIFALVIRRHN